MYVSLPVWDCCRCSRSGKRVSTGHALAIDEHTGALTIGAPLVVTRIRVVVITRRTWQSRAVRSAHAVEHDGCAFADAIRSVDIVGRVGIRIIASRSRQGGPVNDTSAIEAGAVRYNARVTTGTYTARINRGRSVHVAVAIEAGAVRRDARCSSSTNAAGIDRGRSTDDTGTIDRGSTAFAVHHPYVIAGGRIAVIAGRTWKGRSVHHALAVGAIAVRDDACVTTGTYTAFIGRGRSVHIAVAIEAGAVRGDARGTTRAYAAGIDRGRSTGHTCAIVGLTCTSAVGCVDVITRCRIAVIT